MSCINGVFSCYDVVGNASGTHQHLHQDRYVVKRGPLSLILSIESAYFLDSQQMCGIIDIILSHHSQLDRSRLRITIEEFHYIDQFASRFLKQTNCIPRLLAYTKQSLHLIYFFSCHGQSSVLTSPHQMHVFLLLEERRHESMPERPYH